MLMSCCLRSSFTSFSCQQLTVCILLSQQQAKALKYVKAEFSMLLLSKVKMEMWGRGSGGVNSGAWIEMQRCEV